VPLNSVQLYVNGLLNGLVIPGVQLPLQSYITPPMVEDIDGPRAYVWGGRLRGGRQTMPRFSANNQLPGFKKLNWSIDVWLTYETTPDSTTIDQEFPVIVDTILNKTWTTTMPLVIQDPTTQQYSQILAIGEDFELEYPPERAPATLRMVYYTARIGLDVYEAVQL
jgi:hypothetical protein